MRRTPARDDPDDELKKPLKFSIGSDDDEPRPVPPRESIDGRRFDHDSHRPPTLNHLKIIRWLVRMFPRFVLTLVVVALVVALLPGGWRVALCAANVLPPPPMHIGENITIIGHRGCEFPYPENTAKALRHGAELVGFVELDIALTSDGDVIAMHDTTLDRTTNGSGITCHRTTEYVRNLYVKMPKYDASGRIKQARFCTDMTPAGRTIPCTYRVPTLNDVFNYLPQHTRYMIDAKECHLSGANSTEPECSNCTRLLEGTKKAMADNFIKPEQVTFTSTIPQVLKFFKDNMPAGSGYALGMDQKYSHYKKKSLMQKIYDGPFGSASLYIGLAALRPDFVWAMRDSKIQGTMKRRSVFAWTVRRDIDYRLARCAGVTNVIAAEPERVLRRNSWDVGSWLAEET